MKIPRSIKIIFWIIGSIACAFGGIFGYFALRWSFTWLAIVYTPGYGGHYSKEIGEFNSLEKCRAAAEETLKLDNKLQDKKIASEYICGRGCYLDPLNRDPVLDDYQCFKKFGGTAQGQGRR